MAVAPPLRSVVWIEIMCINPIVRHMARIYSCQLSEKSQMESILKQEIAWDVSSDGH